VEKAVRLCNIQQIYSRPPVYPQPLRDDGFEVLFNDKGRPMAKRALIDRLPGVFATIAGGEPYTEIIPVAPVFYGSMIIRSSKVLDRILAAARAWGIAVCTGTLPADHERDLAESARLTSPASG
jgi:hypothetical protein